MNTKSDKNRVKNSFYYKNITIHKGQFIH